MSQLYQHIHYVAIIFITSYFFYRRLNQCIIAS